MITIPILERQSMLLCIINIIMRVIVNMMLIMNIIIDVIVNIMMMVTQRSVDWMNFPTIRTSQTHIPSVLGLLTRLGV